MMAKLGVLPDIRAALALLTRLPLGNGAITAGARAAWAWPVAGLVPGGAGTLAAWIALGVGLPPSIAAGLAVCASIAATGALHEDGLADTADGFWGGWTRERRLEIMKDSRIGTYGVLALAIATGLRWAALAALMTAGTVAGPLVAAALLSRAAMLPVAAHLPHARRDGLSAATGRPPLGAELIGVAFAAIVSALLIGPLVVVAFAAAGLSALVLARLGRARIGGQTGDLLGATQQVAEIAVLLTLTAAI